MYRVWLDYGSQFARDEFYSSHRNISWRDALTLGNLRTDHILGKEAPPSIADGRWGIRESLGGNLARVPIPFY